MSEYQCCHVDADTILFRAANSVQENYIVVTNIHTKDKMEFSGVQEFYGKSYTKKDGGWIGQQNLPTLCGESDKPLISANDYTIEHHVRFKPLPEDHGSHIDWAMGLIDFRVGAVKKTSNAKSYKLWIGGEGNFRYDAAHIQPYKGKRKDKPLIFKELRTTFLKKYKNRVCIAGDSLEGDDELSIKGWESYKHFKKTGKHKYILAYIDKDLKMIPCPYFNYDQPELGVVHPTIEECCKHFCKQIITGDDGTDNIPGLKGYGDKTALKLLEGRNTPKEMYEAVVLAYKDFYGLESFPFTSHRGVESTRTWLDMLRENAKLLYLLREPNEVYNIEETFKRLGVEYD